MQSALALNYNSHDRTLDYLFQESQEEQLESLKNVKMNPKETSRFSNRLSKWIFGC